MECVTYERKQKSISWMELSVLVTLWLPQELRSASETFGNSHISPCRESNQNHYACTLFLPYYMCIWAMFVTSNAIDGLKYYLLPDFSKFNFTVFSQAATQVLFSVGIGNIIVPPRFGLLSNIKLPWLDASGISHLGI